MTGTSAEQQIAARVASYIESINAADPALGATIWATTPAVSFIRPRGTERGWNEIAANFYETTMGATFAKRTLRLVSELRISINGDAAVVDFEWDFVAVRRDNGETLHTTGRESQVFSHIGEKGWRLIHVHYSGTPVTGTGQGF